MKETRVPHDPLVRDILLAHLKAEGPARVAYLEKEAGARGTSVTDRIREELVALYPRQTAFVDDAWFERQVPLEQCYFAHTDFRLEPVPKDSSLVCFLEQRVRERIEAGDFPCAEEIQQSPLDDQPPPLVQEREEDRFYVLDGQLRVIRRWYHGRQTVRVYVYRGQGHV